MNGPSPRNQQKNLLFRLLPQTSTSTKSILTTLVDYREMLPSRLPLPLSGTVSQVDYRDALLSRLQPLAPTTCVQASSSQRAKNVTIMELLE